MLRLPKFKNSLKVAPYYFFLFFFFCNDFVLSAQENLTIGQWRSHLPYQRAYYLAQSPTAIYASTQLSIFSIDKESNEVSFLSKVNGLSDVEMNLIKYDPYNDKLIAVYNNSNVDLIDEESVTNLPFIQTSQGIGDKRVFDVFVENETTTYFAMGFGLKVLNVKNNEFGDETKAELRFNSVAVLNNAVYAATPEGVYRFDRNTSFNIQDFGEWDLLGSQQGFPEDYSATTLAVFEDALYTSIGDTLFRYDGINALDSVFYEEGLRVHYMSTEGARLIVGLKCCIPSTNPSFPCDCSDACSENCDSKILFMEADGSYLVNGAECANRARYAIEDEKGQIWYADNWRHLRKADSYTANCNTLIRYNSPLTPSATDILIDEDNVWVATELHSISPDIIGDGFFSYIDNTWTNYNDLKNKGPLDGLNGYLTIALNPNNKNIYYGTVDDGIAELVLETDNSGNTSYKANERYNESNSSLRASLDPNRIRVTGMDFDDEGNLWIANQGAQNPLVVYGNDETWFNSFLNLPFKEIRYMVVDDLGYKWFAIDGAGQAIMVYDDGGTIADTSDDQFRTFNSGNSEIPSNFVFSLAVDLDGDVWVGTTEGIVIFECGANVFDTSCRGSKRILEVGGFNAYLLESEEVTAIAIDGANRKWVGTGNGVFVLSPSGEEQIAFFDKSNSPLFDNQINAIEVNQNTGEVYIGTAKGLISYRSDAVAGGRSNSSEAFVFPNPVRPDYSGPIAIKGLARDANIKITDINGQLIYETTANGGQAIWDGRDYKGRKASSGVYLVFSTNVRNIDTPDAIVGKILFMK